MDDCRKTLPTDKWIGGTRDRAVLALILVLFATPAVVLALAPQPARFGFQMFSGYGDLTASWIDRDGATHQVNLGDHLASVRTEVDWTAFLPEQLCERIGGAVRVEVRRAQPGGDDIRSVTC